MDQPVLFVKKLGCFLSGLSRICPPVAVAASPNDWVSLSGLDSDSCNASSAAFLSVNRMTAKSFFGLRLFRSTGMYTSPTSPKVLKVSNNFSELAVWGIFSALTGYICSVSFCLDSKAIRRSLASFGPPIHSLSL